MKKRWLSLSLALMLMSGTSVGAFAETVPAGLEMFLTIPNSEPIFSMTELTNTQTEADALRAQIESLTRQLMLTKSKAEQAAKNSKSNGNKGKSAVAPGQAISEYAMLQGLINQLTGQIGAKQNSLNTQNKKLAQAQEQVAKDTADKYSQQETNNLKAIEAILKKNDPRIYVVQPDHIITDNPTFKVDMPMIVKDSIIYMPKTVLEKQFGLKISYEESTKKFVTKIEGQLVEMFILQSVVEIDGVPQKTEGRPMAIDGKIYFPMNDIDKLLNVNVKWNNEYKVILIDDLDIANPVPVPTPVIPTIPQ